MAAAVGELQVATAQARRAQFVTADETIQSYPSLARVWADPPVQ